MSVDADKAINSGSLSRREFLKMAGAAGAGAFIPTPDSQKQEPLPPREKLTDTDLFNMALPINARLDTLSRRSDANISTGINVIRKSSFVDGDFISKWERAFPRRSLDLVIEGLKSADQSWVLPRIPSLFAYPKLDFTYQISFDSYQVVTDQNTGRLVPIGPIQEVTRRNQKSLFDAVEISGGQGFIGEMWELQTLERYHSGELLVTWWAKRGIPLVERQFGFNTPTDFMANIGRVNLPGFYYSDANGNQFFAYGAEDVLFVPVGILTKESSPPAVAPGLNA